MNIIKLGAQILLRRAAKAAQKTLPPARDHSIEAQNIDNNTCPDCGRVGEFFEEGHTSVTRDYRCRCGSRFAVTFNLDTSIRRVVRLPRLDIKV